MKATFDITIIAEEKKIVLSNMVSHQIIKFIYLLKLILLKPLKEKNSYDENPDLSRFSFETTPFMSSYLAAFVVGEYGIISGKLHNNAPVNVYTPLNCEKMGEFALDVK
jgi:aminopeptidase N